MAPGKKMARLATGTIAGAISGNSRKRKNGTNDTSGLISGHFEIKGNEPNKLIGLKGIFIEIDDHK
jgi:hypothetical protein